jgi:hypothetical protein
MTIPPHITGALYNPVNYSPQFTEEVARIRAAISGGIRAEVQHNADMNYRASQSLSFTLSSKAPYSPVGEGTRDRLARASAKKRAGGSPSVEIRIYVSSRARLFCLYCFDKRGQFYKDGIWEHPVPEEVFPPDIRNTLRDCRHILLNLGYDEVKRELFNVPAAGCLTELDDLPATIFQVLFTEWV